MKRLVCSVFSMILCLLLVACGESAEIEEFKFELNEDQTEYILVEYNYSSNDAYKEAIIPATYNGLPVTKIGDEAFEFSEHLESVSISEGITHIDTGAFAYCEKLKNISIPKSVCSIENGAFENCDALESIIISQGLDIGFGAFENCDSLKSVVIGDSGDGWPSAIGQYAFSDCLSLETVTLGMGVSVIEDSAFRDCEKLAEVNLSNSLVRIYSSAFQDCNLDVINFSGTKEEWDAIDRWSWWDLRAGSYEIICTK